MGHYWATLAFTSLGRRRGERERRLKQGWELPKAVGDDFQTNSLCLEGCSICALLYMQKYVKYTEWRVNAFSCPPHIHTSNHMSSAFWRKGWPPDGKNWLIGKDPDAGKAWEQEKGKTEDEMVGLASSTWWTWVWVDSSCWWWTGQPGMLPFMGSQRVRHDWVTELNRTERGGELLAPDKSLEKGQWGGGCVSVMKSWMKICIKTRLFKKVTHAFDNKRRKYERE